VRGPAPFRADAGPVVGPLSRKRHVYHPAPAGSARSIMLEMEGIGTVPDIPISENAGSADC
ncbi:hypothetical protein, partial [Nonomuraea sp. NPDC049784]|uniref:hypothetical protein n=1 Tax=Nonomuraea sp. NPDC049784 TaxID=3154361 RepID=UPI0033D5263C